MELRFAFIGFGNVARAFARILERRRSQLADQFGFTWRTTAIATARHGCITTAGEIDLIDAADCVERGASLATLPGTSARENAMEVVEGCGADLLFETTPLNPNSGEPAVTIIRRALERSMNVITANKGPVAFAYRELKALASEREVSFRFEGTVMDGAPVFNLVERCLPATKVTGFSGLLNSTTNLILTGMEEGRSFASCLEEAQRAGIAEANADYDIDGWDAAVKAVALANVLMGADLRPEDVERKTIRNISQAEILSAARSGAAVRVVSRARMTESGLKLSAMPETITPGSPLMSARGTSNILLIETDLMGEIAILEHEPGVEQTAYALVSDLISVHRDLTLAR
ncbi:MAG TPA: homoserine dehydrogenase [Blastocatellia bacterium]|nr:homoserine dehydrogenase [Blastocatellia bacterium]